MLPGAVQRAHVKQQEDLVNHLVIWKAVKWFLLETAFQKPADIFCLIYVHMLTALKAA